MTVAPSHTTMKSFHPRYRPLSQPLSSVYSQPPESNLLKAPCLKYGRLPQFTYSIERHGRDEQVVSRLARLRQTNVRPVYASLLAKPITALSSVCPCDLRIVRAQQSFSGSCVLVMVLPSPSSSARRPRRLHGGDRHTSSVPLPT